MAGGRCHRRYLGRNGCCSGHERSNPQVDTGRHLYQHHQRFGYNDTAVPDHDRHFHVTSRVDYHCTDDHSADHHPCQPRSGVVDVVRGRYECRHYCNDGGRNDYYD